MTCRGVVRLCPRLHGGRPSRAPSTKPSAWHLQACPNCERYLISYQKIVKACRHAFDDEPPPPMPEELVTAILKSRQA